MYINRFSLRNARSIKKHLFSDTECEFFCDLQDGPVFPPTVVVVVVFVFFLFCFVTEEPIYPTSHQKKRKEKANKNSHKDLTFYYKKIITLNVCEFGDVSAYVSSVSMESPQVAPP